MNENRVRRRLKLRNKISFFNFKYRNRYFLKRLQEGTLILIGVNQNKN